MKTPFLPTIQSKAWQTKSLIFSLSDEKIRNFGVQPDEETGYAEERGGGGGGGGGGGKKYGGRVMVKVEKEWFLLKVLIPLPTEEELGEITNNGK